MVRLLENVLSSSEGLSQKPMFGSQAYFVFGNMVCFVTPEAFVGVKLLDEEVYETALEVDGIQAFAPSEGAKPMKNWVLIDTAEYLDSDLEELLEFAAEDISKLPPKVAKTRRKPVK